MKKTVRTMFALKNLKLYYGKWQVTREGRFWLDRLGKARFYMMSGTTLKYSKKKKI